MVAGNERIVMQTDLSMSLFQRCLKTCGKQTEVQIAPPTLTESRANNDTPYTYRPTADAYINQLKHVLIFIYTGQQRTKNTVLN